VLESGDSSTLFLLEIWVCFQKKYFLQLCSFKMEIGSVCSK
jgi:hypothetical protein